MMSRWNKTPEGRKYYRRWVKKNRAHVERYRKAYYKRNQKLIKRRAQDFSRMKLYGVTPVRFAEMKTRQRNRCFICGKKPPAGFNLGVDHNHKTSEVRVLLCAGCNWLVGRIERLGWQKLEKYVELYLKF